jgi:hypothetical protein
VSQPNPAPPPDHDCLSSALEAQAGPAGSHRPTTTTRLAGWRPFLWPTILVALAFAYYGQYYSSNSMSTILGDEGSAILLAQRLLHGERPYCEIELGYGVLWFYPLVLLFHLVGPNWAAAKIYFFALATMTSVLAYLTLVRLTRRAWLAAAASTLVLLVPGVIHKSYIPLLVVGHIFCFTRIDLRRPRLDWRSLLPAALVVSLSWLIRTDLGLMTGSILLVMLVCHAAAHQRTWRGLVGQLARQLAVVALVFVAVLGPEIVVAKARGYARPMLRELASPVRKAINVLEFRSGTGQNSADAAVPPMAGTLLARMPLASISAYTLLGRFAFLTYAPIAVSVLALGTLCAAVLLSSPGRWQALADESALLVAWAVSATAFPQFFYFRPCAPHLSQFMPGFLVFLFLLADRLWRWRSCWPAHGAVAGVAGRCAAGATSIVLASIVAAYAWLGFCLPGLGSWPTGNDCTRLVTGPGARVWVDPDSWRILTAMQETIHRYSRPEDYVLGFPYAPGINVLAGRPTFLKRVYCDDSYRLIFPAWQEETVRQIVEKRPAVILISDMALNGTEVSRFRNWATDVQQHIESHYRRLPDLGEYQCFVRP